MDAPLPQIYTTLAPWYLVFSAPDEYEEEAAFYLDAFTRALGKPPRTVLELGSGSGNMASHYKAHVQATLTDISPAMLDISRVLNPECGHVLGDMCTLRLGRTFDAVFVHDAVMYLTREDELRQAVETAYVHTRPGGVAVFAPDYLRDTFQPHTKHGGRDGDGRSMRYLEWAMDPDRSDTRGRAELVYLLHEDGQEPRMELDVHEFGLFDRDTWLGLLTGAGFGVTIEPLILDGEPYGDCEIFICRRPA
jgi:SAM-dependent methyltransferase